MGLGCSRSRPGYASCARGTARARSERQAMVGGEPEVIMAITQFKLGAEASCTDGVCGVLVRILLDPRPRKVTALSTSIGRQGVSCGSGVTSLRSKNSNGLTT